MVAFPFPPTLDVHDDDDDDDDDDDEDDDDDDDDDATVSPDHLDPRLHYRDAVAETGARFDLQTCPAVAPRCEDSLHPGVTSTAVTRSETKTATWKHTTWLDIRQESRKFCDNFCFMHLQILKSPRRFLQRRYAH